MPIGRDLIRQIRTLDAYDLRRLQMLIRGLLEDDETDLSASSNAQPSRSSPRTAKVTFRQEMVKCGKQGCTRCPHGPYWYAYWREDGRTRSRYVGKNLPGEQSE